MRTKNQESIGASSYSSPFVEIREMSEAKVRGKMRMNVGAFSLHGFKKVRTTTTHISRDFRPRPLSARVIPDLHCVSSRRIRVWKLSANCFVLAPGQYSRRFAIGSESSSRSRSLSLSLSSAQSCKKKIRRQF